MAEIRPVTSEALEAQIRNLLPSQQGFGEDLQATNVITPIIDLTNVAEGTNVPEYQQQALAFGSQNVFSIVNTTTVIANTPGFYRIYGISNIGTIAGNMSTDFTLSDGVSTKLIWRQFSFNSATVNSYNEQFDFIVFLAAGESISGTSSSTQANLIGSSRQIADVNGNPVNPSGFTPQ